jgi:putative (di)nucleoside polyphosphate hydrolase
MATVELLRTPQLPLRDCVGIAVFNRKGKVWIGQRSPKWLDEHESPVWQMPQGGIERGEQAVDAAVRELREETGISSVELVEEIPGWLSYELPPHLLGVALKGRYRGQRQRWFAMRFTGRDSEIDIGPRRGLKAEFEDWRWESLLHLPALVAPFKRRVYRRLVAGFAHLAR